MVCFCCNGSRLWLSAEASTTTCAAPQGKRACHELEQQVLEGLKEFPENSVLTDLLQRARGSIGEERVAC